MPRLVAVVLQFLSGCIAKTGYWIGYVFLNGFTFSDETVVYVGNQDSEAAFRCSVS